MTWNFRIMRQYNPESPEYYWYEIVECYYGEDGRPMMWNEATLPIVDELDVEIDEEEAEKDLEFYIKESLKAQFVQLAQDIDIKGPIMDQRDFEYGGVYYGHPEYVEMQQIAQAVKNNDQEALRSLGIEEGNPRSLRDIFDEDDEDDEQG